MPGAHAERPQLKKLLAPLAPGDVVVVPVLDRLLRDTIECGGGGLSGEWGALREMLSCIWSDCLN